MSYRKMAPGRGSLALVVVLMAVSFAFGLAAGLAREDERGELPRSIALEEDCRVVDLDNVKHARVLANVWEAREAGHPTDLHVARAEADANRRAAVAGYPTVAGMDRDEYPPAVADEGGGDAHVAYAPSSENRSAGAVMGNQLEGLTDGACFRFEARP